ncbi:hypothetical protein [Corynebacterium pelargi]|uniref:Uncharacterized protein n=1 Tax=Corynebacterium pelargi TaxID=1471400 RepID=A0A410WAQ1_9CORY|nr:hypothetical protein [Corynebacterium pelargi]QAU53048.1 hypothetical protein CPELA_08965 [Corynebacterium pelargi]GGG75216.1 hypothetical protein GCM10007338_10920 [Corynebacterium pelargi]
MNPSFQLFDAAVQGLRGASNGLYAGPHTSRAALEHAFGATAGLNPSAVAAAAKNIGGKSDPENTGVLGTLGAEVLEFFAEQAISEGIESQIEELFQGHQRNTDIGQSAGRAGEAMECIDQEAARTCNTALGALSAAMGPLLSAISATNPILNPLAGAGIFQGLVRTAEGLINATSTLIMGTCQARDEAIGACLDQLRGECESAATAPSSTSQQCLEHQGATPAPVPPPAAPEQVAEHKAPSPVSGGSATPVTSTPEQPTQPAAPALQKAGVHPASISPQATPLPGVAAGIGQAVGAVAQGVAEQLTQGAAQLGAQAGQGAAQIGEGGVMQETGMPAQTMAEAMQGFGISIDIDADIHLGGCEEVPEAQPEPECPEPSAPEPPAPEPEEAEQNSPPPAEAEPQPPAPSKAELAANAAKPQYAASAATAGAEASVAPEPPAPEPPAPEPPAPEPPVAKKAGGWS